MRKRQRKKVSKYKCLKCGCKDGIAGWSKSKNGRWISTRLFCFHCDMGMPRIIEEVSTDALGKYEDFFID